MSRVLDTRVLGTQTVNQLFAKMKLMFVKLLPFFGPTQWVRKLIHKMQPE